MIITALIYVFTLSFAAFTLSVLSGWVVADVLGAPGEGAVLGGVSSLFLALVLTKRRAFFGKTIFSGALAGLIAFPIAAWLQSSWGWFAGGAFFGLALGAAHWRLHPREVKPLWAIVLLIGWGLGFGGLESGGDFYGLFLGAVLFALVISLAAARPLGIVQGWATQTHRKAPRIYRPPVPPRPAVRRSPRTKSQTESAENGLAGGRAPARKRANQTGPRHPPTWEKPHSNSKKYN